MNGYTILKSIILKGPHHAQTGRTRHYEGNVELPPAAELKIVKYEDSEGYYLLYFDADGNEVTDTFHDTMEDAFAQAEWEFNVKPFEWEIDDDHSKRTY